MIEGVLLDTNVWRYLSDAGAYTQLLTASHRARIPVVVAPAVVYETLAIGDPVLRERILILLSRSRWQRLMPEAYNECEEIRAEINRLHPEWLLVNPDLWWWNKNRRDWKRKKRGFWERIDGSPGNMAKLTKFPLIDEARAQSINRRKIIQSVNKKDWLDEPFVDVGSLLGGSKDKKIPLWRVEAATVTAQHLRREGAYKDWLAPWLDARLISQKAWNEFWFYEVEQQATPRQWIRSRVEWLQGFRKISPGSPGDSQLSSYLFEANYIATSDTRFADVIDECAESAPVKIASTVRLPGGMPAVERLIQWFFDRARERVDGPSDNSIAARLAP